MAVRDDGSARSTVPIRGSASATSRPTPNVLPHSIQLRNLGEPDGVTRRRALLWTTAAVATALAGCGSPGDGGDDPGFENEGEDEGTPPAGEGGDGGDGEAGGQNGS